MTRQGWVKRAMRGHETGPGQRRKEAGEEEAGFQPGAFCSSQVFTEIHILCCSTDFPSKPQQQFPFTEIPGLELLRTELRWQPWGTAGEPGAGRKASCICHELLSACAWNCRRCLKLWCSLRVKRWSWEVGCSRNAVSSTRPGLQLEALCHVALPVRGDKAICGLGSSHVCVSGVSESSLH